MSLHSKGLEPIPEETRALMERLCPKGTQISQLRDLLGPIYRDASFAHLFPKRGRGATAPWRMALVLVFQALEGLTDRQAAEAVRTRIDWRYALSLPLDDPGFDFSILTDFRTRLIEAQAQEVLLEEVLQICRAQGWLAQGGHVRTDATAIVARVRALSSLESVGESMRAALNALAEVAPVWLRQHLDPDWFDRYVHRFELTRFPKAESQRALLREQVGADVARLLGAVEAKETPEALGQVEEVALLRQIFGQHYEVEGSRVRWRDGPAVSNEERVVSPYDPEARSARKREQVWLGYKVHLSETCDGDPGRPHLIVHVSTTAATIQDCEVLGSIGEDMRQQDLAPAFHYVDQGYSSGEQVVEQARVGTQLIGPVGQDPSWQARQGQGYGKDAFVIDWHNKTALCPQGQRNSGWTDPSPERSRETVIIRFPKKICQGCPVREQCTRNVQGRRLTLTPEEQATALTARRSEQAQPEFRERYARRAGVEGTISQGVRTTRMRRTPYVGVKKTHLHHVCIATALNLRRIVFSLQAAEKGQPARPVRPRSPFARLQPQEVA